MDISEIKTQIEETVKKIQSDEGLMEEFKKDPIKTVEKLTGVDLPDDQLKKVVDGIKAKMTLDDIGDKLGGIGDALGGLLGKKK